MATHANINFINMENIFQHSCVSSLQYDDFTSLAEDFATMHINEDALDTLESYGFDRSLVKASLNKGHMNHATASYVLLTH